MAKQMGIHQIRGKIGERSYYKTKGVDAGISRSINQGLSARVKSAEEYANTRLNNAEFKNANAIASSAFNSVPNRVRGMMRNFAVAEMTKKALEDIKQGAGDWGARHPLTELDVLICTLLEQYAKLGSYNGFYGDYSIGALNSSGEAVLAGEISKERQAELNAMGIDALQIVNSRCLAGEIDVDGVPRLYAGHGIGVSQPILLTAVEDITMSVTMNFGTYGNVGMSPAGYAAAQEDTKHGFFLVCTILPLRKENNKYYVMQEYCTYIALPVGQIPE